MDCGPWTDNELVVSNHPKCRDRHHPNKKLAVVCSHQIVDQMQPYTNYQNQPHLVVRLFWLAIVLFWTLTVT